MPVPVAYEPVAAGETWRVYAATADQDANGAALAREARRLLTRLEALAPAAALDAGEIRLPDGRSVRFDLEAGPDQWVIAATDGEPTARAVAEWARLSGTD